MKSTLLLILCSALLLQCRKDDFTSSPDARVSITVDTLKYDTVFATVGSVTQSFKIINDNNKKIRLSSVKLMGGSGSAYKMNVDGVATTNATEVEIAANDSVYVFVQVKVDPGAGNLPFIIRDSIQVSYNGNQDLVQLEAWGQNAHFYRNKEIKADETWTNDLPYVILGYLYVAEDTRLSIEKGCRIYLHADAPIVIDGSLQVNGEKDSIDRVYFRGDRLDDPYRDFPAAWPGIYFSETSKDNVMTYAVIKNSYQSLALQDPSPNANPKLTLNQCIIDNSFDAGIVAINSSVVANNCLISNCGKNIVLNKGGSYQFTHCTVASYSNSLINHKDPVLSISDADGTGATAGLAAVFRNCIFWGENGLVDDEVLVSKSGATPFSVSFDHVLWKVKNSPANASITQAINNIMPAFDSIDLSKNFYDFHLKEGSPAIDAGTSTGLTIDLDGRSRPVGLPDLGSYERQ